jgi:hypothetical protein
MFEQGFYLYLGYVAASILSVLGFGAVIFLIAYAAAVIEDFKFTRRMARQKKETRNA